MPKTKKIDQINWLIAICCGSASVWRGIPISGHRNTFEGPLDIATYKDIWIEEKASMMFAISHPLEGNAVLSRELYVPMYLCTFCTYALISVSEITV